VPKYTVYKQYKFGTSGYETWDQKGHSLEYLVYPDNVSESMCIDELSLSKGELYTFVTSKKTGVKNKKSLVAVINGTDAETISKVLLKIPESTRLQVKETSMDMARNMESAITQCFTQSTIVKDRFHVVRLVMDAVQQVRIKQRWQAIEDENEAIAKAKKEGQKYIPSICSNGDTLKELLARSRYLLYSYEKDWTVKQNARATILFEKYPEIKTAYDTGIAFRNIYAHNNKELASVALDDWVKDAQEMEINNFQTAANSIQYHKEGILNYFDNQSTNANAESFNAKVKLFRSNCRGVADIKFFLFRIQQLFA
jgi:transposase